MHKQRFLIIPLLLLAFFSESIAQKAKINTSHRKVVLTYEDSTLKADVLMKPYKKKPELDNLYYWFNNDDINKNLGGYQGKLLDGDYSVFDLENNLIREGQFKKGMKNGIWKSWNKKGGLLTVENWKEGRRQGKSISYTNTGQLLTESNYKGGQLHGKSYVHKGDKIDTISYKKGVIVVKDVPDDQKEGFLKRSKKRIKNLFKRKDMDSTELSVENPDKASKRKSKTDKSEDAAVKQAEKDAKAEAKKKKAEEKAKKKEAAAAEEETKNKAMGKEEEKKTDEEEDSQKPKRQKKK